MKREPVGLYIFRVMLGIFLLAFMCLLYFSSTLIEKNMLSIQQEMEKITNRLADIKSDIEKIDLEKVQQTSKTFSQSGKERKHISSKYPNILTKDPYYEETLPKLLPKNFKPKGSFTDAIIGKPHNLHPFSGFAQTNQWVSLCIPSVSALHVGVYETYAPSLAIKIEERKRKGTEIPEFWVHLRDDVYWQPLEKSFFPADFELSDHFLQKHQVTSEDFKFYFHAVMNPFNQEPGAISIRTYLRDIEEIEIIDDLTFIVRWKAVPVKNDDGKEELKIKYSAKNLTAGLSPLASFLYKYFADGSKIVDDDSDPDTYLKNAIWGQNFTQHWAKNVIPSCGAWKFDGFTDRQIAFKRNPDFFNPYSALAEKYVFTFRNTPDAIWQDFKAAQMDHYNLQPDQEVELEQFLNSDQYITQANKNQSINQLEYLHRSYIYLAWNQAKPFFKSKKVRQAMTMAIDRERIIDLNLNGLGTEITGSFFKDGPSYDHSIEPFPFDPLKAKLFLAQEGWVDTDGDGIVDKVIDGKKVPFSFTLTYYVKNPVLKAVSEYLANAMKNINVECKLNGVDLADISAIFEAKSFDALFMGWALGTPPEDPRQLWHSSGAKQQGSSNSVGFSNAEADKIIEKLEFEYNPEKRIELYHRFSKILHEEQPYTFLYTPKVQFLYREWLQNVFIPSERHDLIPKANVSEPISGLFWINTKFKYQ